MTTTMMMIKIVIECDDHNTVVPYWRNKENIKPSLDVSRYAVNHNYGQDRYLWSWKLLHWLTLSLCVVWRWWWIRWMFAGVWHMRMMVMMMMMLVMQNAVVVFLPVWLLGVFVMEFLCFRLLFCINWCHNVRDFKVHKKRAIFVLFGFVLFILVR